MGGSKLKCGMFIILRVGVRKGVVCELRVFCNNNLGFRF